WLGYGLGGAIAAYRGRPMLYHSGGIDGFRTDIAILPEDRIGVMAAVNVDGSGLPFALALDLADRMLGVDPRPWLSRLHERTEDQLREQAPNETESRVVPGTSPSHPLVDYVADYAHPGYGLVPVTTAHQSDVPF